jgi:hypothetical protein
MTVSAKQAFHARITSLPEIGVARRVYFNKAPQKAPRPYVVLRQVTGGHDRHMEGACGISPCYLQADCFADSDTDVTALADAIRMACDGFRGAVTVADETVYIRHLSLENDTDDLIEPQAASDAGIYHVRQDWSIVITEPVPTF